MAHSLDDGLGQGCYRGVIEVGIALGNGKKVAKFGDFQTIFYEHLITFLVAQSQSAALGLQLPFPHSLDEVG